ncbi:MAG: YhbY family RNA-binding protein, partial [Acidiferrobacterales bacterium]|nr:YhbY family RNA-binding protein [Acidiferrobacterales bacterium]
MTLTGKQKNYLRGIAHNKNPIVMIGNKGLTDAVM